MKFKVFWTPRFPHTHLQWAHEAGTTLRKLQKVHLKMELKDKDIWCKKKNCYLCTDFKHLWLEVSISNSISQCIFVVHLCVLHPIISPLPRGFHYGHLIISPGLLLKPNRHPLLPSACQLSPSLPALLKMPDNNQKVFPWVMAPWVIKSTKKKRPASLPSGLWHYSFTRDLNLRKPIILCRRPALFKKLVCRVKSNLKRDKNQLDPWIQVRNQRPASKLAWRDLVLWQDGPSRAEHVCLAWGRCLSPFTTCNISSPY